MNLAIIYTCVTNGPKTSDFIARFVATWMEFPPGADCDLWVSCNGGPLSIEQSIMLAPLGARMFPRVNDAGFDLTGYMDAVRGPCENYDAVLCLGESNYFHRAGWLKRLADAWEKYGPGMYGPYASNSVRGHLNTTAFFCPTSLIRNYPVKIATRADRYEFEHGQNSCWRRASRRGMPVMMVTWNGEWEPRMWRSPRNIIWRGDQTNCLMWCNHTDNFANINLTTRINWANQWDQPFK